MFEILRSYTGYGTCSSGAQSCKNSTFLQGNINSGNDTGDSGGMIRGSSHRNPITFCGDGAVDDSDARADRSLAIVGFDVDLILLMCFKITSSSVVSSSMSLSTTFLGIWHPITYSRGKVNGQAPFTLSTL